MVEPVMPNYESSRKLGIELEIDVGQGNTFRLPDLPSGWVAHTDGSLASGRELVLDPPLTLTNSLPKIRQLCERLVNYNVRKKGGLHVHVQVHDYTHLDAYHLVKLYTVFQPIINRLVGQSRVGNTFCPTYSASITLDELIRKFKLNHSAENRMQAKQSRVYSVINCAMMRCRDEADRTVEFRQGSVSKRYPCVAGWAILMVVLVELAKNIDMSSLRGRPSLEKFKALIRAHEQSIGANGVADWVQWRHDYLNAEPTDDMLDKVVSTIKGGYHGIYTVSRELDINLAFAKKLLDYGVTEGRLSKHPSKEMWTVTYKSLAEDDLLKLEEAGERLAENAIAASLNVPPVPAL